MWFLNAFFRSDGGNNHANFNSSTVDSLLDKLSVAEEHSARVAATGAAQEAILAQVPVSNLVTPFWHVSVSDRVGDYQPWGSDYYVIRADLFAEKAKPKPKPSTTLVPVNKDVGSCKKEELDFIVLNEMFTVADALCADMRVRRERAKSGNGPTPPSTGSSRPAPLRERDPW